MNCLRATAFLCIESLCGAVLVRMSLAHAAKELAALKGTADELREGVVKLEAGSEASSGAMESKILSERITQTLLKVDGLPDLSKSSAAEAVKAKDLKTAREISVLIAKRKRLVKLLNDLGDRVDKLSDLVAGEASRSGEQTKAEDGDNASATG